MINGEKVRKIYGVKPYKGDFGFEVELESQREISFPGSNLLKVVSEGSLRDYGYEIISGNDKTQPCVIENLDVYIDALSQYMSCGKLYANRRCGLHVHINVQEFTDLQLLNFIRNYYVFESLITSTIPNDRKGNIFALRGSDMGNPFEMLQYNTIGIGRFSKSAHFPNIKSVINPTQDSMKYSALNLANLSRLGSVEYRFMPSTNDTKIVKMWVKSLYVLTHALSNYKFESIRDLIDSEGVIGALSIIVKNDCLNFIIDESQFGQREVGYCMSMLTAAEKFSFKINSKRHFRIVKFSEDADNEIDTINNTSGEYLKFPL